LRPLPVCLLILLIPAAAALQSGRRSRAAAEFCTPCSLDRITDRVKGYMCGSGIMRENFIMGTLGREIEAIHVIENGMETKRRTTQLLQVKLTGAPCEASESLVGLAIEAIGTTDSPIASWIDHMTMAMALSTNVLRTQYNHLHLLLL
jgi:hypothetical protein